MNALNLHETRRDLNLVLDALDTLGVEPHHVSVSTTARTVLLMVSDAADYRQVVAALGLVEGAPYGPIQNPRISAVGAPALGPDAVSVAIEVSTNLTWVAA